MDDSLQQQQPTPARRVVVVSVLNTTLTLRLLLRHLRAQKAAFDELHLWINTLNPHVLAYCGRLAAFYGWMSLVKPVLPINGTIGIKQFYQYCTDAGTNYLYLPDSIAYLSSTFVEDMFVQLSDAPIFVARSNTLDDVALFLAAPDEEAGRAAAVSCYAPLLTSFAWTGSDFAGFGGVVDCCDVTECFGSHRPTEAGKPDKCCPSAVCVRYDMAIRTEASPMDILRRFEDLSPPLLDDETAASANGVVVFPQTQGSSKLWVVA